VRSEQLLSFILIFFLVTTQQVIYFDFISFVIFFLYFFKQKIELKNKGVLVNHGPMTYFFTLVQITIQDLSFGEIPCLIFYMIDIISTPKNVNVRAPMVDMDVCEQRRGGGRMKKKMCVI